VLLGALPETRPAALLTAPFAGNPRHDHKLWVTAVVRPIRFHDLRHTTGSRLTMRGANTGFVQRIMRHSDPCMTERYSHFDPEYLHSKLDELMRFQPAKPTTDPEPVAAVAAATPAPVTNSAAFSAHSLPDAPEGGSEPDADSTGPSEIPVLAWERDTGFEPATFSLGS